MMDMISLIFSNKQIFTYLIITLYLSNFLYQIFITKDYLWAGYWISASCITIFAMGLSNR